MQFYTPFLKPQMTWSKKGLLDFLFYWNSILPMYKFYCAIRGLFSVPFFLILFAGCASLRSGKPVLIERTERMFWEIKSPAATVFVLAVIDFADDTFYPLEGGVLEAFKNSDFLVTDLGANETKQLSSEIKAAIFRSVNYQNEKNILKHLSDKEISVLYDLCGKENVSAISMFDPWVLKLMLDGEAAENQGFLGKKDLNLFFLKKAGKRYVESLLTAEEKLSEINFGTWDEQLLSLKNKIKAVSTKKQGGFSELTEIKKLYLSDERQKLHYLLLKRNIENAFSGLAEERVREYKEMTLINRNKRWAEKLRSCLKKGGTTFVFGDAAHFCGENGVFQILEKQGVIKLMSVQ